MKCDQCELLSINGHACHEIGCPNRNARWDEKMQGWVKQYECSICGFDVDEGNVCCDHEDYQTDADVS